MKTEIVVMQKEELTDFLQDFAERILLTKAIEKPIPLKEVAKQLSITSAHIKIWYREDGFPLVKLGSKYFAYWSKVQIYMDEKILS